MADGSKYHTLPQSVLFCCDHNAVRSPMAEGIMKKFYGTGTYVQSVGVRNDMEIDGFSIAVCQEMDVELSRHRSRSFDEMEQLGWVAAKRPKLVAVQAAGCQPLVKAIETGATACVPWPDARTADPAPGKAAHPLW